MVYFTIGKFYQNVITKEKHESNFKKQRNLRETARPVR